MDYYNIINNYGRYFLFCEKCGMKPEDVRKDILEGSWGNDGNTKEEADAIAIAYRQFITDFRKDIKQ